MTELKQNRTVSLGCIEITVAMPERGLKKLTRSVLYKRVVRPLMRWGYHRLRTAGTRGPNHHSVNEGVPKTPPSPESLDPKARGIIERIVDIEWYQSIDLGHGVVTPGFVDHRPQLQHYSLPESMEGLRCLDVATWDGFWAFEMERRGAADVVALDVAYFTDCDIPRVLLNRLSKAGASRPTGEGFRVAREILGSNVRREICNVYDLSPERLGKFDFVFVSDLLLHLRNPQLALERAFSVCRGKLVVADVYNPVLERYGDVCLSQFQGSIEALGWWAPNTNTLKMMLTVAGFEPVVEVSRFMLNAQSPVPIHKVVFVGLVPKHKAYAQLLETAIRKQSVTIDRVRGVEVAS